MAKKGEILVAHTEFWMWFFREHAFILQLLLAGVRAVFIAETIIMQDNFCTEIQLISDFLLLSVLKRPKAI